MLRVSPIALLATYWVFLFFRTGLTDVDRDPFYVASILGPVLQMAAPGFLLLMGAVCLLEIRRLPVVPYRGWYGLIACMTCLYMLSFVANGSSTANAIQFFFGYLQYAILIPFTALVARDSKLNYAAITRWIIVPIIVQFAINFGWLLKINPLRNERRYITNNVDWAYGTLMDTTESAGIGALLVIFSTYFLLFRPPNPGFSRKKVLFLFFAGTMLMLLADSKLTYGTVSIALGLSCFATYRVSFVKKIGYATLGAGLLSGLFLGSIYYNFLFNPIYSRTVSYWQVVQITLNGTFLAMQNNPKFVVYRNITQKLPADEDFPIFGAGPGNATSRFAIKDASPLASKYILPEIEKEFRNGNSMLRLPNTGFNSLLGDLGWSGVILYFATFLFPLGRIYRYFRQDRYTGLQSAWAFVFLTFAVYFVLQNLIGDKLYLGVEVTFLWVSGVILMNPQPGWEWGPTVEGAAKRPNERIAS